MQDVIKKLEQKIRKNPESFGIVGDFEINFPFIDNGNRKGFLREVEKVESVEEASCFILIKVGDLRVFWTVSWVN